MVPQHVRKSAVARLRSTAGPNGQIPPRAYAAVSSSLGVSVRTLQRWLFEADSTGQEAVTSRERRLRPVGDRPRWIPTEAQLAIVAASPNIREAHRDLLANDPNVPSYDTLRRSLGRMDSGIAAAITRSGGGAALIANRVYLTVEVKGRNQRWVMDSQEIPVRVLATGETKPRKFWQTTALDEATRMVMATVITPGRPTSQDVVACIAKGIHGFHAADGTFVGGLPQEVAWDNAAEFLADQVTSMALSLGFTGTAVTPYAPYEKGKIEVWHKTIQNELYSKLPGASHGPQTFSGRELWVPGNRELLDEGLLVAHVMSWVERYNEQRRHQGLRGATPLARWSKDSTPIRRVSTEMLLESMLVEKRKRRISKNGIRFCNNIYIDAALNSHVGRTVTIRHLPHDDSFVEVFLGDTHLCTAIRSEATTPEERMDLLVERREQYEDAKRLMTEAAQARLRRYEKAIDEKDPNLPPLSTTADPRKADSDSFLALFGQGVGQVKSTDDQADSDVDSDSSVSSEQEAG